MQVAQIIANVQKVRERLEKLSSEKVFLVAATKTQSVENINAVIRAGVDAVAENRVQEFRDKRGVEPCERHFIGRLQTNKVKYLVGEISLFHSCDRLELLREISRLSLQRGVISDVLMQINIGREETKGGFLEEEVEVAYEKFQAEEGVRLRGFMAMLPNREEKVIRPLARKMRELYEKKRKENPSITYLSMGMSGDFCLCVEEGSNMVRLGSTLFGGRD